MKKLTAWTYFTTFAKKHYWLTWLFDNIDMIKITSFMLITVTVLEHSLWNPEYIYLYARLVLRDQNNMLF